LDSTRFEVGLHRWDRGPNGTIVTSCEGLKQPAAALAGFGCCREAGPQGG
jgi:hypothetical protein